MNGELIHDKLDGFHREVIVLKHALDANLKNLDTTYNNIQHKITSYQKHINDYLDQIQKQITDEAAEMKKTYEKETNKLIAKNESMKSELEDILQKIQNGVNVNAIFVINEQAEKRLGKMKNEITEIEKTQQKLLQQQHYVFRPSIDIEKLVSTNTPLGKLVRKPNINTTASYRETINVKAKIDKKDCCINDCTLLGPDRMVVTDGNNKNIKLIDIRNQTVISSYKTSVSPWGVTPVNTDQVAVTFPEEGKIQLLNVTSTFTEQHEIQVNKYCYGIAYKDEKFAVTYKDQGLVEILDRQGQVLHTIEPKRQYVWRPVCITFGQDKDTVIVSDSFTNNVNVVTFQGHFLHTYARCRGKSYLDITPDGVLFVCSECTCTIHVVSSDFKTSKIIIKTVEYPHTITYCDINHRLYISNIDMRNTIIVYDMNALV